MSKIWRVLTFYMLYTWDFKVFPLRSQLSERNPGENILCDKFYSSRLDVVVVVVVASMAY